MKLIETSTKILLPFASLKTISNSDDTATSMGNAVQNLTNLKKMIQPSDS